MQPNFEQLKAYYDRNFGDARRLYQYFADQIASDMRGLGIKWGAVEHDLTWQAGIRLGLNGAKYLQKGAKTAAVYADIKNAGGAAGIEYPVITLTRRGIAEAEYVFNGWAELTALAQSEAGLVDLTERQQAKLAARAAKQQAAEAEAQRKAEAEAQRREAARQQGVAEYLSLPPLVKGETPAPYLDRKQLWGILPHCAGIKRGTDERGGYMAIPLHSILAAQLHDPGEVIGVQKIYDRPFARKTGELTDKDFTFGLNKVSTGAFTVIGNLADAEVIYAGEGWATCASAMLAHNQYLAGRRGPAAALVCMDSGQLKLVIELALQRWPWLIDQLVVLQDNDAHKQAEGKGNAGVMAGLHLTQQYPGLRCQLPDLSEADAVLQPTDFNDLHCGHYLGLKAVAKQLTADANRFGPFRDGLERECLRLAACPVAGAQRQAEAAALAGAAHYPVNLTPEQILQRVQAVLDRWPRAGEQVDMAAVRRALMRRLHWRVAKAKLYRAFSRRITDKRQRPDHINYIRLDQTGITDQLVQQVRHTDGIIIIRAGMGTGKTQRLIKPLMWEADRAAYFAHRVSLIGSAHQMLTTVKEGTAEEDVPWFAREIYHYQEREAFGVMNVKKMASCINSINKDAFTQALGNLDLLAIDEASQTIKAITNGGTMARPLGVYQRLLSVAAKARQVLLLDADANDSLVMWAEQLRERRADGLPITIIELATDCSHLSVLHGELNAVYADIVDKVGQGFRCLVATDSADEGERLAHALREQYPTLNGLYVSQDTKSHDEAVERFNNRADAEIQRYDWLIYSPAISSGVSIEVPHMQLHYGLFRGVVSPSDAVQMLRRDRTARQFILGLGNLRGHRQDDENAYWRATLRGMMDSGEQLGISFDNQTGAVQITTQDLGFDQLRIRQVCEENSARNDFANVILLQLMGDSYQVAPLAMDNSEAMKATGEALKKRAGQQLAEEDCQRILAAETPSHSERETLIRQLHLTREQRASLDRWNIEHYLQQGVNPESVHWLRQGGMSQAKRVELLCMAPERATALDKAEADADLPVSTRSYLVKSRQLLLDYLQAIGLDASTGTGEAGQQQLSDGLALLRRDQEFLDHYCSWCPGLLGRKRPADLFKAITDNLGLVADKHRLPRSQGGATVWRIQPDSWQKMMAVEAGRRAQGISSWSDVTIKAPAAASPALLLGIGQATVTYHPLPQNAVTAAMARLPSGILAPASTTWRTGPGSVPIAPQTAQIRLARGLLKAGPAGLVRIHNSPCDLIVRSEVVDPLDHGWLPAVRQAAEAVGCRLREALGLLSWSDRADIAAGGFPLPDLVRYLSDARRNLGPLFGRQGGYPGDELLA